MPRLPGRFLTIPLAHRALHDVALGRPENSRAAISAAIAGGYGIETDVQLSADNRAMAFHDYALDRLTDAKGPVRQRNAEQLQQIRLKGGQEAIPALEELLALVAGRVPLLVELKDQDGGMGPNVGPLEEATARALRDYQGEVAVMSFNPHSVTMMGRLVPHLPRGLVTSAYRPGDWPLSEGTRDHLREIPDYARSGASFISHEADDLTRDRVAELKSQGTAILCWTIKSPAQEARARAVADNITFEGYLAEHPA